MSTFYTDISINKNYPSVEYAATEPGASYFEDREIDGVMYHAQNATFNGTTWHQVLITEASYATTQNLDGSISHLMMPAGTLSLWTLWKGNGQRGVFDVRDFGALGDGSTDDHDAIQAANDAAVSAGGGYIYLSPGMYLIKSALLLGSATVADVPITMGGEGAALSTLFADRDINGGVNLIMVANAQWSSATTSIVQNNIYIEKLGFNANAEYNLPVGNALGPIYLKQVGNCGVSDCEVFNSSGSGILISGNETHGDWPVSGVTNFKLLRNHINLNYLSAVSSTYPGVFPICVEGANIGTIHGNTTGDLNTVPTSDAIYCPGSSDIEINDNYVTMCDNGIVSNASTDVILSNNRVFEAGGFGISTFASTKLGKSGVTNLTVTGNTIVSAATSGIRVSSNAGAISKNFAVTGNVVALGSSGPFGIHIEASQGCVSGNVVDLSGTTNTGICIDSSPSGATLNGNITVTGNTINNGGSGSTGILFKTLAESKSTDCVITGNSVFGVSTPLGAAFSQMQNCVIRSNPGINPWMGTTITPSLTSGGLVYNAYPFDVWVTVTGGTVTSILINGNPSGVKNGSILLPGGSSNTIKVNFTGSATWTWLAY